MKNISINKILWLLIGAYIVFFCFFTCFRHYNFQTQAWDMGIFDQIFWNTINGKVMQSSLEELPNHLGIHMSPLLFLFIPGYVFFPSPYFLLIIQTIFLGLGAWPLFLLTKTRLKNEKIALVLSASYLLYPALHWINSYDFHEISFLVSLFLFAAYFCEIGRFGWASVFLALGAASKEDAILAVAFFGLYLIFLPSAANKPTSAELSRCATQKKIGVVIFLTALIYFFITIKILMPAFGGGLLRIDRYSNLGSGPIEIIKNVFTNPPIIIKTIFTLPKMLYLLWLFLPVAFLPLLSWRTIILLIPGLAENLLTNFGSQFTGFYQYDSMLVAGIFIGTIYGIEKLSHKITIKWLLVIILSTALIGYIFRSPVNPVYFPIGVFKNTPVYDNYRKMIKMIPNNVSVSAHTTLVPHLSHRENIYMMGTEPYMTDYLLIDGANMFGFGNEENFNRYFDSYVATGKYETNVFENRFVVLKKK